MLASSMERICCSTQVPSTRSSSRNPLCLLLYTKLHERTYDAAASQSETVPNDPEVGDSKEGARRRGHLLTRRRRLSSQERSMGMAVVFGWVEFVVEKKRLEAAGRRAREEAEGRTRQSWSARRRSVAAMAAAARRGGSRFAKEGGV